MDKLYDFDNMPLSTRFYDSLDEHLQKIRNEIQKPNQNAICNKKILDLER